MSERSKLNRKAREERQEKQAKHVIAWIGAVLIVLALAYVVWTTVNI
ncbi:MAG: hypothetical protein K6A82_00115 [Prevotella sp.]|nr:hypothetical protein [Prevotella sp.]